MRPPPPGSSSRLALGKVPRQDSGVASLTTTVLLAVILATGPLFLGGSRSRIELPLLGVVALLLLFQGLRLVVKPAQGVRAQMDAIDITVVLFVLYTVGLWLASPTEYFSRLEALNVIGYAGVFLTCRHGLTRRLHGVILLFVLVALGLFETGFGYYLHCYSNPNDLKSVWYPFGSAETLHLYYFPRWLGTYGCPNHYGSLLVMATGAAVALGCFSRLAWPVRIVLLYLAGMMVVGLIYSGSRGSWLSFVAAISALTIFGLRHGTVRWWIPLTGMAALLLIIGAVSYNSPEVRARIVDAQNIVLSGKLDTYVRVQLAEDALRIARDHPIFGTGPGTFVFIHPRYQSNTFSFKAVLTHNDYLNCLDDYGLIGFGLAMLFVALVTLKYFRPLRADNRWQDRTVIAAGFAAWAALVVHSVLDFNLHIPANAFLLFALTGLALGRLQRDEAVRHWSSIPLAPLGRVLGWTVVVLSLAYGVEAGRSAASDILYEQAYAKALEIPTNESIRSTEEALAYDARNAQALIFLGDLYRFRASQEKEIEGRVTEGQKALDAYQKGLQANAIDDTIKARLGRTYDIMRRYTEAFFNYQAAATAQPNNGEFWYWLGNHYWQRGLLEKAEQAYLRAQECPYGAGDSAYAEAELRKLPQMGGIPLPETGTNPLTPATAVEEEHPATTP